MCSSSIILPHMSMCEEVCKEGRITGTLCSSYPCSAAKIIKSGWLHFIEHVWWLADHTGKQCKFGAGANALSILSRRVRCLSHWVGLTADSGKTVFLHTHSCKKFLLSRENHYTMGSGRKWIYLALIPLICNCTQVFWGVCSWLSDSSCFLMLSSFIFWSLLQLSSLS
jgi:hypothetical protein